MEDDKTNFKVVLDCGSHGTEVVAWTECTVLGKAAWRAAVMKYPKRNIDLRDGARVVERYEGGGGW